MHECAISRNENHLEDLVSKKSLIATIEKEAGMNIPEWLRDTIMNAPSAQKTGHWIEIKYAEEVNEMLVSNYECSECHYWERYDSNFCPNCGAYMRGEKRKRWRSTELNVL